MAKRRKFTAEQKVRILRQHLVEKVSIADICDKHGLHPNLFYRWQKEFFENGAAAFQKSSDAPVKKMRKQIDILNSLFG
ncbi:transposase [bacterium]|nr:transposase [bacterium]